MIKISLIYLFMLCLYLFGSDSTYGYSDSFRSWCNPTTCLQLPKRSPGSNESINWELDPCHNNSCTVYSFAMNGAFFKLCGECGMLGSKCNVNNVTCQSPGFCYDNYCHCPIGNPYYGICIHYLPIANSEITITLIATLIALLILLRLISSHKFIRRRCCTPVINRYHCWRGRSGMLDAAEETTCGHNPDSGTKSAAYTIATRDFLATSSDPDLEWALELSMQIGGNPSTSNERDSSSSETTSSSREGEGRDSLEIPGTSGTSQRQFTLIRNRQQQSFHNSSMRSTSSSASSDYSFSSENPDADVTSSATAVLGNSRSRGFLTDSLKRNHSRSEVIMTRILEDSTQSRQHQPDVTPRIRF